MSKTIIDSQLDNVSCRIVQYPIFYSYPEIISGAVAVRAPCWLSGFVNYLISQSTFLLITYQINNNSIYLCCWPHINQHKKVYISSFHKWRKRGFWNQRFSGFSQLRFCFRNFVWNKCNLSWPRCRSHPNIKKVV